MSSLLSLAVTKVNSGRKGLIQLTAFDDGLIIRRSQCRTKESGSKAETIKECCLLACPSWLVQFLSFTTQEVKPPWRASFQWPVPSHISHSFTNAPEAYPQADVMKTFFSIEVPFPKMILAVSS